MDDRHERAVEAELKRLAARHPLYPRAWKAEVERRATWPGWDIRDAVFSLKEEHGLIDPGLATIDKLIDNERRFLAVFEPDELLPEIQTLPARSSAD